MITAIGYRPHQSAARALAHGELQRRLVAPFYVKRTVAGTDSTGLVEAARVHLISATPGIIVPAKVAEFEELDGGLVEGLDVVNGAIHVPEGPDSGQLKNLIAAVWFVLIPSIRIR